MRDKHFPYLPKDFIQTKEGLIFAVVSYQPQADGKVGCFLRYIPDGQAWIKVDTEQANQLLKQSYPQYLYQSTQFDSHYHAVAVDDIAYHHQPEQKLKMVLQYEAADIIAHKLHKLVPILLKFGAKLEQLGLTGSMLIDQHRSSSDIDLVVYGREHFHQTRCAVQQAVEQGHLAKLDLTLMQDNFQRRAGELSFDEFAWHENRKFNKSAIEGSKFDIGMVCLQDEHQYDEQHYQKQGQLTITAKVLNDERAFDFPACYIIDDEQIQIVMSFTHTYVGQAKKNEIIEVSGTVERNIATGECRLIVGSTREAEGEYIKVCR